MTTPTPSLAWRFWANVPIGPSAECWLWSGPHNRQGYGTIDSVLATRLMRGFIDGSPVPAGLCALHRCDNPPCVNPAHLWIGTRRENAQDAVNKGRWPTKRTHTHCRKGHEFTVSNTILEGSAKRCRICRSQRNRIPANRLQETE